MRSTIEKLTTAAKVMPILAVAAFFISLNSSTITRVNGEASCTYLDYFALFIALLCVASGLGVTRRGVRPSNAVERSVARWHVIIGVLLLVLGVIHALRGLGLLFSPCP